MKKRSFGPIFSDELSKVNFKSGNFKGSFDESWKDFLVPNFNPHNRLGLEKSFWRVTILVSVVVVLFFAIFLRLFHLQIVEGKQNRELADGNRIQVKIIHAPRGVIFDRHGKVVAANSPGFRLKDSKTQKSVILTRDEALEMEVKNDPRTNELEVDNIRTYPFSEELAHVLGYVGEINPEQLKNSEFKGYGSGDLIGQSGIESVYEKSLRGVDGGEIIEVDATGKKLRTIRKISPIAGKDVHLTVDASLQSFIYKQLKETTGKTNSCCAAAVAADPSSGQILALVSYPSFDNNLFTKKLDTEKIAKVFSDKNSPILNRVIGGTYPPGSTFKILSSIAALQSGKITPSTTYEDTGQVLIGPYKFTNWFFTQYGKTEGPVNLVKALKRSNDTYFYLVGQAIGEQALIDWSRKMKMDSKLGIDLPGEVTGLIPDNNWKVKTYGQVWFPGDTLHMAIGQGFVLSTPLQILGLTSFIAADGNLYKPRLVSKVTFGENINQEFKEEVLLSNLIPKDQIEVIKEGLEEVTLDGGTAWPFLNFPISSAGKTGTAEFGDPKDKTHAWYTGFAPVDDPKIVMTVLIEAGGEGSSVASPIVKESFRYFFSTDKSNLIKDIFESSDSARTLGE